ncbi:Hypothetical_protein [Hexamita inflata]|uniref:Hypothetical_protein n=1 Tax=Hexamita inflata TaxID=28002 RepID=A0AA86NUS2_9EUKA|nr:Hypothetical protein HINF_LOCUS13040 [Hexamita inflata]
MFGKTMRLLTMQRSLYFELLLKVESRRFLSSHEVITESGWPVLLCSRMGPLFQNQSQIKNSLMQFFSVFKEVNIWQILFFEDESQKETLKSWTWSLWRYPTTTAEEDQTN